MTPGEAVEANLAEWLLAKAAVLASDVEVHRYPDVFWTFTRKAAPSNTAVLSRWTSDNEARAGVTRILSRSLDIQAACNWVTGPLSQPASLPEILREAGFSCRIHCAGMVRDLRQDLPDATMPRGVTVGQVDSYPAFEPLTTERRKRIQAMQDGVAGARHFAATLDKRVVGRTTLFLSSAAAGAGIYDVEVLKHARYRGVGTALVHAALRQAIVEGQTLAVLAATGSGFSVYQRLGFRDVTKISFWRYGKMRQV